jgi:N-acetylmuramoyl-L-alanine amidase
MRQINRIIIHCTAASGDQPTQNILDYWRKKGWASNGYHWLVDGTGLAVRLMGDQEVGNGVKGFNSDAIHLCYKGGWNGKDTRTEAQKGMLEVLVSDYRKQWPDAEVLGHRDLSPDLDKDGVVESHEWVKLCPCFDAKKEYK